jgi:hypothetical protein
MSYFGVASAAKQVPIMKSAAIGIENRKVAIGKFSRRGEYFAAQLPELRKTIYTHFGAVE